MRRHFAPLDACVLLIAEFRDSPGRFDGLRPWQHSQVFLRRFNKRGTQPDAVLPVAMGGDPVGGARDVPYDLWGVPDYAEEELEEAFLDRSESLGVYTERGFGGQLCRTIGAWDKVCSPVVQTTSSGRRASLSLRLKEFSLETG